MGPAILFVGLWFVNFKTRIYNIRVFCYYLCMCRLFAYDGNIRDESFKLAVEKFSNLSVDGCVPCGVESGHLDGFGLHFYSEIQEVYFRSVDPIKKEIVLNNIENISSSYGQGILHIRKATVGKNYIYNTHPFINSGISFCHNGSILSGNFTNNNYLREGQTDSEVFFLRIIDRIIEQKVDLNFLNLKNAIDLECDEIKKTNNWTSLTFFLKTKSGIILKYLWNENHPDAEKMQFEKYYTFYVGRSGFNTILCSEVLNIEGYVWERLNNNSFFVLDFVNK
jgi:predicted glutamine amidotransferase